MARQTHLGVPSSIATGKVAILGGGIAALTAAYELASQRNPDSSAKYEITIYQMGWRLGGKLATGRNQDPEKGNRIEEHGIHGFFGSYFNAKGLMHRVFADLGKINGLTGFFTKFEDAFVS